MAHSLEKYRQVSTETRGPGETHEMHRAFPRVPLPLPRDTFHIFPPLRAERPAPKTSPSSERHDFRPVSQVHAFRGARSRAPEISIQGRERTFAALDERATYELSGESWLRRVILFSKFVETEGDLDDESCTMTIRSIECNAT